jgi:hypothetical protein
MFGLGRVDSGHILHMDCRLSDHEARSRPEKHGEKKTENYKYLGKIP